jgi:hypothetical protein
MRKVAAALANVAGRRPAARRGPARPRPVRVFTADEQRLLNCMAKAHGKGGEEWALANAELILDQAYAIGNL